MNLNKDYIITVDVKNATVTTPGKMNFYITDIKTANIFTQLVINDSNNELIKKYAPIESAQDYKITLRVVKPNNEFKEIEFSLLNQLEAFFMVDLTEDFKDIIGTYKCELFVDCIVNSELERITTASFRYAVKPSITNNLDEIIEADPDYPLIEGMIAKMDETIKSAEATIANTDSRISENIENTNNKIDENISNTNAKINENISNTNRVTEELEARIGNIDKALDEILGVTGGEE